MPSTDDHIAEATKAFIRYQEKQAAISDFEKRLLEDSDGNKLLASLSGKDQQYFRLAIGNRESYKSIIQTEATMAIVGLLLEIRSLLRDIKARLNG